MSKLAPRRGAGFILSFKFKKTERRHK